MVENAARTVGVFLGDGLVRVKAGEVLEHTGNISARAWSGWKGHASDRRPGHPPELAPGKNWSFIGTKEDVSEVPTCKQRLVNAVERDIVYVFQEGLTLPADILLACVNEAHAVLVLRVLADSTEYHYLHNDLVMSADEEESLMEWGVGRLTFGNPTLAVGGTLLVVFAEQVWQPAIIGTLLVATASYRVQGVLTKVLRVWSPEWKANKLVSRGIHGTERAVQLVLLVLVVLADLLEDRVLLLTALISASVYVVLLETIGQAVTTWGWRKYTINTCKVVGKMTLIILGCVGCLWLDYVFAGALFCIFSGLSLLVLWARASQRYSHPNRNWENICFWFFVLGTTGVVGWVACMDWKEAGLKVVDPTAATLEMALDTSPRIWFLGTQAYGSLDRWSRSFVCCDNGNRCFWFT